MNYLGDLQWRHMKMVRKIDFLKICVNVLLKNMNPRIEIYFLSAFLRVVFYIFWKKWRHYFRFFWNSGAIWGWSFWMIFLKFVWTSYWKSLTFILSLKGRWQKMKNEKCVFWIKPLIFRDGYCGRTCVFPYEIFGC